jgi:hypothetical protein
VETPPAAGEFFIRVVYHRMSGIDDTADDVSYRRIRMNEMDKRKFGYYVFGGALIGAFLGLLWAGISGLAGGAIVGTFIGWFAAAYFLIEKGTGKK